MLPLLYLVGNVSKFDVISPIQWKYLGIPLLLSWVTKNTFGNVLERISATLSSWKAKLVNLAGKHFVSYSYLCYASAWLPQSICDGINKIVRSFIWSSEMDNRGISFCWARIVLLSGRRDDVLGINSKGSCMSRILHYLESWVEI